MFFLTISLVIIGSKAGTMSINNGEKFTTCPKTKWLKLCSSSDLFFMQTLHVKGFLWFIPDIWCFHHCFKQYKPRYYRWFCPMFHFLHSRMWHSAKTCLDCLVTPYHTSFLQNFRYTHKIIRRQYNTIISLRSADFRSQPAFLVFPVSGKHSK